MTLHTLRRRASKDALQMAPLAHDLRMAAAELEAGTAVIEFDVGTTLGRCLARPHEAQTEAQRDCNCSDQPHRTKPAMHVVHIGNIPVHSPTHPRTSAHAHRLFLPDNIIGNIIPNSDLHHIYLKVGNQSQNIWPVRRNRHTTPPLLPNTMIY